MKGYGGSMKEMNSFTKRKAENGGECVLTESELTFDKKFKQLFDLEMQREGNPGYPVVKRGVYYCCRLISRQIEKLSEESCISADPL